MKLKSIKAVGLKGKSFSYELGDATAIIGDNFTGKTAIIEAIRLVLIGWIPEVGKRSSATWELASGPELMVEAEFNDEPEDWKLWRKFWLEGTSVKTVSDPEGFLNDLPLLHADHYFSLTDRERVDYVFGHVQLPDSYSAESIVAECERLSMGTDHTELIQKAKQEMIRDVIEAFEPVGGANLPRLTVQVALGEAIETFRERFSYWNRRAKETQGAVTTMTELKLREKEVVAAAQDVDKKIGEVQSKLDELNTEKGKLTAQQEEADRASARIKYLQKQLDADRIDYPRMLAKLREKTFTLSPELDPKERDRLELELRALKQARMTAFGVVTEQEGILLKAKAQRDGLAEMGCCPFCHAKGKGWRENLATELDETMTRATGHHVEASATVTKKDAEIEKIEARLFESHESERKNVKVRAEMHSSAQEIGRLEQEQASDESSRKREREELGQLKERPTAENLTGVIDKVVEEMAQHRGTMAGLERTKKAETELQQDLKRASQAQLEHMDAAAHVTVIKALAKLLNEKRATIVEEVFQTLLKTANKVAGDVLRTPLAMYEGTIGRWSEEAKFIPHRVFSGTEKALCYIAIATALSAQAPMKLVILDEFGRLDADNQAAVLKNLQEAVKEKVIDQFIVVGTTMPSGDYRGMRVIRTKP